MGVAWAGLWLTEGALLPVLKLEVRLATVEEEKKRMQRRLEDLQVREPLGTVLGDLWVQC